MRTVQNRPAEYWIRLYWFIRAGIAFLWLWTAYVSWFAYPHTESLYQLNRIGLAPYEDSVFAAACLVDASLGVATALMGSRKLWTGQACLVTGYSVVIGWGLPEFLLEPFGPIVKNLAVLACLSYLYGMEEG